MIYLFKAPPNGTPTLDTRSVRKNTSKNTYPITSHHILPRNSFQVGTPCWYKYPVSRAPWGESTVTYRKAYARLKNWMPLGWPYHARHAAALAAQNFVDFKVVATGAAVVGYRRQLLRTGCKDLKQQSQLRYEGQGVQDSNGHEATHFRINAKTWCNQQASEQWCDSFTDQIDLRH